MEDQIEEAELMGRRIVRRLNEMLPEAYIDVSVSKAFQEVSHYTSETEKTSYKSLFSLGATSLTVRSGELLYINEGKDSCTIPEDPMAIIGNIIWKEKMSQNSVECPSKPMQVIFTPKTMPILMKGFTTGLAGRNVASKSSPLSDRIGEKILDSRVSIYDDGIMSAGPASAPFDSTPTNSHEKSAQPLLAGRFQNKSLTMSYFHTGIRTIIGAKAFHCPVRNGKEWDHPAVAAGHWLCPSGILSPRNESLRKKRHFTGCFLHPLPFCSVSRPLPKLPSSSTVMGSSLTGN